MEDLTLNSDRELSEIEPQAMIELSRSPAKILASEASLDFCSDDYRSMTHG